MAEWSKAVDSSIFEYFGGVPSFPTYPGFESQFYHFFLSRYEEALLLVLFFSNSARQRRR